MDAVVAEVDAGEDDFAKAAVEKVGDFVEDIVGRAAREDRPDAGDDAIATVEAATVLDLDVSAVPTAEGGDSAGNVDEAAAREKVGELAFVGQHLDDARQSGDIGGGAGGVAAHHDDLRPGIGAGELADGLAAFEVRCRSDGAGVDQAEVGRVVTVGTAIPEATEALADVFRLVLVHFAAEGDGLEGGHREWEGLGAVCGLGSKRRLLRRLPTWIRHSRRRWCRGRRRGSDRV